MSTSRPQPSSSSPAEAGSERLDSWKEIAAYFRRDESTVRRWEKDGLPVHRHKHKSKASVFAYRAELEAWWRNEPALADTGAAQEAPHAKSSKRWPLAAGALVTIVLLVVATFVLMRSPSSSGLGPTTVFMSSQGEMSYPAFSPDGKQLAFAWVNPEQPGKEIYVKAIGSEAPLRLTRSKDVENFAPAWSADGTQIAFLRSSDSGAGVYVVPAHGGAERKVLSLRPDRYYALDWSPDGKTIAFAKRQSTDDPYSVFLLSRVDGGERQVTFPPKQTFGDLRFAISPDGRRLAFIRNAGSIKPQVSIEVVSLAFPDKAEVVASYPEWIGSLAWSADSRSLVLSGNVQGVRKLWRVYIADHRQEPLKEAGENAYYPAVARQGGRLAFVRELEDADLWRARLTTSHAASSPATRVNFSTRVEGAPRFSPDGKRMAFLSYRSGLPELWVSDPDGQNAVRVTSFGTAGPEFPNWSPDGQTLVFAGGELFQLVPATGGQPQQLSSEMANITFPSWTRDGKSVYACRKGEGGVPGIWKAPLAGGPAVEVVKNGISSMESPNGKFLYFTRGGVQGIWRKPVDGGEETLVVKTQRPEYAGYWTVVEDGIYFLNVGNGATIEFFNFRTGKSLPVVALSDPPDPWRGGLTVSPDGQWLIYSQQQYSSYEIDMGVTSAR